MQIFTSTKNFTVLEREETRSQPWEEPAPDEFFITESCMFYAARCSSFSPTKFRELPS
jgi:hypothetical protein